MDASASAVFDEWVDGRVATRVRGGERNFGSLVCQLPGIYPGDVLASLQRLRHRDDLAVGVIGLMNSAGMDRSPQDWHSVALGLPHPHPLDYEWRFGPEAVACLSDRCLGLTQSSDRVALVATPTMAMSQGSIFLDRRVTYIGADTALLTGIGGDGRLRTSRHVDLLQRNRPTRRFASAIMDPPWYDDHLLRFLWFASAAIQLHGTLLLAMPAAGTRPGIALDHERSRGWCARLGFELVALEAAALPYETPLFERNALRAAGIQNVPAYWRRGDLWVLRKVAANKAPWPGDIARTGWSEFRFGHVRLRVDRGGTRQAGGPSLISLVPGDVLPTVSRRDMRRPLARVWTTGNRIFGCAEPAELARILEHWKPGAPVARGADAVIHQVVAQMSALLDIEGAELECPGTKRAAAAAQVCAA